MKTEFPLVTVIMPIRNEADLIAQSLRAVLTQDYPHGSLEILVSDGMSTDGTRAEIARVVAEHPDISVRILNNPRQIVPTGMNIALREARGDIIVRVDGHCKIATDYVSQCVRHLVAGGIDGVGGPIETKGHGPMSESIALAMSSGFGVGGAAFRTVSDKPLLTDTIAFPAYTRRAIDAAGFYDEDLKRNQDDEYNYRLRKLGFRIMLAPNVRSQYFSRSTLLSLWLQYFHYGLYKVRVMQKHPAQMQLRQFVPPAFVASVLGGGLLGIASRRIRWLWSAMLLMYALFSLESSWRIAARHGRQHLTRLPLVFATLHCSYGLGFWAGLLRFADRWNDKGMM